VRVRALIYFDDKTSVIDHGSQTAGRMLDLENVSIVTHLPASSVTCTSFRMHWSFCSL